MKDISHSRYHVANIFRCTKKYLAKNMKQFTSLVGCSLQGMDDAGTAMNGVQVPSCMEPVSCQEGIGGHWPVWTSGVSSQTRKVLTWV